MDEGSAEQHWWVGTPVKAAAPPPNRPALRLATPAPASPDEGRAPHCGGKVGVREG